MMKRFCRLSMIIIFTLICGCAMIKPMNNGTSSKEKSLGLAVKILLDRDCDRAIKSIAFLDDIDALRIIAVASQATAWPMEAGENVTTDNRMDDLSLAAIGRLAQIGTDSSKDSIDYAKRIFLVDGCYSKFFKSIEAKFKK